MKRSATLLLLSGPAATTVGTISRASEPPVGPLPKGPITTITAPSQEYVAVALNRGQSGLVWRVARAWNTRVIDQTTEANLGDLTVYVFRTIKPRHRHTAFRADGRRAAQGHTEPRRTS
jgi:hypothetical protein